MLNDYMFAFYRKVIDMLQGVWAITIQDYNSVNIKFGRQFEASAYRGDATIEDLIIQTGDEPVLLKALRVEVDGDGLQYQFFENPVFGALSTEIPVTNVSSISSRVSTTQLNLCTTVSDEGTAVSTEITILGSTGLGNSSSPSGDVVGFERPFLPNTTYLLRRSTLTPAQSQRSTFYATWYEGPLDYME